MIFEAVKLNCIGTNWRRGSKGEWKLSSGAVEQGDIDGVFLVLGAWLSDSEEESSI